MELRTDIDVRDVDARRDLVKSLYDAGDKTSKIARFMGAFDDPPMISRKTVERDLEVLGRKEVWHTPTRAVLDAIVAETLKSNHPGIGQAGVEGYIHGNYGLRVRKSHIKSSLARLDALRTAPRRIARRPFYSVNGKDCVRVRGQRRLYGAL